ncbi:hypothetical protein T03_14003 [Trichinella britovi]|uniref:Uncharacterized protein n=1 Tax=Trichinella britovi TaxID=45882 RepID=A0A0V1CWA5_TRIBR|nr:hypothetical protein T03_14003 [Trichinella britovi]
MLFGSLVKYDDIVQVHQAVGAHQASQDCLHEPLKGGRCVAQSKGHHFELVQPKGVVKAVFSRSCGSTSTCQYPLARSRVENHCAPASASKVSSILGSG